MYLRDHTERKPRPCHSGYLRSLTLLVVAFLGCLTAGVVSAQELHWVVRSATAGESVAEDVAVDASGNSYVTGYFGNSSTGTATFGPGHANETTLTSAGSNDMFLAKYDASGALQWVKQAGGPYAGGPTTSTTGDRGFGIAVDGAGNVFVTGSFAESATFGLGDASETTLTSYGGDDLFLAKYDANGVLLWVRQAGGVNGSNNEMGHGVATDSSGNAYVTGEFHEIATFGLGEANETTLMNNESAVDTFVAKYNANGALQWAKRAGGVNANRALAIGVDASGASYITGRLGSQVQFGPGEPNETTLSSQGQNDTFVAKYATDGAFEWVKKAGSQGFDPPSDIAADASGNSYVTGMFNGNATFGAGEPNETILVRDGGSEMYLAKYDTGGALQWAKRVGGTGTEIGTGVAADASGNSYVIGNFSPSATLAPGEANETTVTGAGVFVAKYDATGGLVWVRAATGSSGTSGGQDLALDASGNPHVIGAYSGSTTFGAGEANETTLTGSGFFVANYNGGGAGIDGTIDPITGGTVTDGEFGARAQVIFPGGVLTDPTDVTLTVLEEPPAVPAPGGFSASGTLFVDIDLDPVPAFPLVPPGLTIVLPVEPALPPGTMLSLYRLNPSTNTLEPALDVFDLPVTGTVDAPGGDSATFQGVGRLSTVVGLLPLTPGNKDACKKGGWQDLRRADGSTFKNQGDCIQYVNTGH